MKDGVVRESGDGALLAVHVQPRAARDEIAGLHGDALKVRLKAPPVEGEANAALLSFLARMLDLPQASLSIRSGASSRRKTILIEGLTASRVREILDES